MCDRHDFHFDVDKAYEDQLVAALEASPKHPLEYPESLPVSGVYVVYFSSAPVYVGQARNMRLRLRDHLKRIDDRAGISVSDVTCRFLTIPILIPS